MTRISWKVVSLFCAVAFAGFVVATGTPDSYGLAEVTWKSQETLVLKNAFKVIHPWVKDGDTFGCDYVELPYGISIRTRGIRASNYDACESTRVRFSDVTDAELLLGNKAKEHLRKLLSRCDLYVVPPKLGDGFDTYGRALGECFLFDKQENLIIDLSLEMKKQGFLRPK